MSIERLIRERCAQDFGRSLIICAGGKNTIVAQKLPQRTITLKRKPPVKEAA